MPKKRVIIGKNGGKTDEKKRNAIRNCIKLNF